MFGSVTASWSTGPSWASLRKRKPAHPARHPERSTMRGSSQAIAFTWATSSGGKTTRPARPLPILKPRQPLLEKALPPAPHHLAPVVERVAHTLATGTSWPGEFPTPLTQQTRITAWDQRKPDRRHRRPLCWRTGAAGHLPRLRRNAARPPPPLLQPMPRPTLRRARTERSRDSRQGARSATRRATRSSPRAAQLRGTKNAAHQQAVQEWKGERPDPEVFRREVLPGLRGVPIGELAMATGLSDHYCALIRLGKKVPHPRHWSAFESIVRSPDTR
jgi:hypothetical protein